MALQGGLGGSWEEEMGSRIKRYVGKADELKRQCAMGLEELQAVAVRCAPLRGYEVYSRVRK